jgi:anaerobic magnesium-protoporphyrin IX monomethyl ester cyclase
MPCSIIFSVLNAKFVHASPAPWCLAAGVKAYAPELYPCVQIVEGTINQPVDTVLAEIVRKAPSFIGLSCYIWNIQETIVLCEKLKQALPDLVIMLGGPEVSFCPTEILEAHAQVDYTLKGEGEESVPAFLKALFGPSQESTARDSLLERVPGLCRRLPSGKIEENDGTPLAYLPPSPLTAGYAEALNGRIAYLETSRGCPYGCAFCLSGRNDPLRVFPLEESVSYLLRLAQSQTQTVKFVDRTFNANVRHCNGILTFILLNYGKSIPRGIRFHFEMAGDILQEETFELLRQMPPGAVQLEIGMQSFHEKTLAAVHRKTDTQVLKNNVRRLLEMRNLHIHIDLIAGLPYEDLSAFTESFNTAYSLGAQMLQLGF